MKTVYKYPLHIVDEQLIQVGGFQKILHIGLDPNNQPCIWCQIQTDNKEVKNLKIIVVGTGNPMPDFYVEHIGSFLQTPFVWHVFEIF